MTIDQPIPRDRPLSFRDGNGESQVVAYVGPSELPGFHWVKTKNATLLRVHANDLSPTREESL